MFCITSSHPSVTLSTLWDRVLTITCWPNEPPHYVTLTILTECCSQTLIVWGDLIYLMERTRISLTYISGLSVALFNDYLTWVDLTMWGLLDWTHFSKCQQTNAQCRFKINFLSIGINVLYNDIRIWFPHGMHFNWLWTVDCRPFNITINLSYALWLTNNAIGTIHLLITQEWRDTSVSELLLFTELIVFALNLVWELGFCSGLPQNGNS